MPYDSEEKKSQSAALLTGWKEIASYLGVEKSTAQRKAKLYGLPVRRLPGSGVLADPAEIDAWLKTALSAPAETAPPEILPPSPREVNRRQWLRYAGVSGAIAAVSLAGYGIPKLRRSWNGPPLAYRVEGATLIVLGKDAAELWRFTFPEQLYELAYRGYEAANRFFVADLDGDGKDEVLFHCVPTRVGAERYLVCFRDFGKVFWKFYAGKKVIDSQGREFAPPFWPFSFQVVPSHRSKGMNIVVGSIHNWSFPTQVAVLEGGTGKIISEYWHRGHLLHGAVADLDGDGEPEVLLGGVNDAAEYKQATVVIFDHRRIAGATKNPKGGVYFRGMEPGTEKNRIFFPKTAFSQMVEFNIVEGLQVFPGRIQVTVTDGLAGAPNYVIYELDYRLTTLSVTLCDLLVDQYRQAQRRGELPEESLETIAERLRQGVRVL